MAEFIVKSCRSLRIIIFPVRGRETWPTASVPPRCLEFNLNSTLKRASYVSATFKCMKVGRCAYQRSPGRFADRLNRQIRSTPFRNAAPPLFLPCSALRSVRCVKSSSSIEREKSKFNLMPIVRRG